jgi:hypothetical protein
MKKVLLFGGGIIGAYLIFKAMQKKKTDKTTESAIKPLGVNTIATRPVDMSKPVRRPIDMIKPFGMTLDMYKAQLQ